MRPNNRRMLQDLADITGESQEDVLDKALRMVYRSLNKQRQADNARIQERIDRKAAALMNEGD